MSIKEEAEARKRILSSAEDVYEGGIKDEVKKYVDPEEAEYIGQAFGEACVNDPSILLAQPKSIFDALVKTAKLKLRPQVHSNDTGMWLVVKPVNVAPRGAPPKWEKSVIPVPSIRLYEASLFESGAIKNLKSNVVRASDEFVYETGINDVIRHIPNNRLKDGQVNEVIAAWAVVEAKDGRIISTMIPAADFTATKGFMNFEQQLNYSARRKVMKEVRNTWMHDKTFVQGHDFSKFQGIADIDTDALRDEAIANQSIEAKTVVVERPSEKEAIREPVALKTVSAPSPEPQQAKAPVMDNTATTTIQAYSNAVVGYVRENFPEGLKPIVGWMKDNKAVIMQSFTEQVPYPEFAVRVAQKCGFGSAVSDHASAAMDKLFEEAARSAEAGYKA